MNTIEWISISETNQYPDDGKTVWMYNYKTGFVALGCLVHLTNEGYFWAVSNGVIYSEKGQIVTDCTMDDDYDITHWCYVPELPVKK